VATERRPYLPAGEEVPVEDPDDSVTEIALPFPFSYYGKPRTSAWVDVNGQVAFRSRAGTCKNGGSCPAEYLIPPFPDPRPPNDTVYVFGDDLQFFDGSEIRRTERGSTPHRQFVIEWHDIGIFDQPTMRFSASVAFSEDGRITFQYTGLRMSIEKGLEAVVGVENANGTGGTFYAVHEPRLADGDAVVFTPSG
jgi:hypothetical protein